MSILKKRVVHVAFVFMALMLVFVQSAYAASVTASLKPANHSALSNTLNFSVGDTISFYGTSSLTSVHNVELALFDPDAKKVSSVILSPNSTGGDTYTVQKSGDYLIGVGCGGTGQTGCSVIAVMEPF